MPEAERPADGAGRGDSSAVSAGASEHHTPEPSASRSSYLPQLDGLRAVAILMVFVHHAYGVPLLWSGVDLFFILSGYLITNILLRDSARMNFRRLLGNFYLRRAQRILPAYIVCLTLIALFTQQNWHRLWPFYAFFLQNLPYAFDWIGFSALIPLWSLAVEQHFYLFWPFLVYFLPRRALAPMMVGVLLGLPVLRVACTPLFAHPEPIYVLTPFRIDAMAAGSLVALMVPRWRVAVTLRWAQASMIAGVAIYALLALDPNFRRYTNAPLFNGLGYSLNIVVLGGLFVWALLAGQQSWLVQLLACSPMRGLGRISYAFYLMHFLVLTRFGPYFSPRLSPLLSFLLTAAVATLSWYGLERPVLALGGGHKGAAVRPRPA